MENINVFLIDFMIVIYLMPCAYILVKSFACSLLTIDRNMIEDKYYIKYICFRALYVVSGQLAVEIGLSFNNALSRNFINNDALDMATGFYGFLLCLDSLFMVLILFFALWRNSSMWEIFLSIFFYVSLPLVIVTVFSNFSLKIMKILCDMQTSMYREFLADEYGLGALCFCVLAIMSLEFMFHFYLNISRLFQNTDDENELVISEGEFKSRMIVEPEILYEKEQLMKDENANDE